MSLKEGQGRLVGSAVLPLDPVYTPIDGSPPFGSSRDNGLEMSRPAGSSILHQTRFAAAGRVGSIELLGGSDYAPRCALGLAADIQVG